MFCVRLSPWPPEKLEAQVIDLQHSGFLRHCSASEAT